MDERKHKRKDEWMRGKTKQTKGRKKFWRMLLTKGNVVQTLPKGCHTSNVKRTFKLVFCQENLPCYPDSNLKQTLRERSCN